MGREFDQILIDVNIDVPPRAIKDFVNIIVDEYDLGFVHLEDDSIEPTINFIFYLSIGDKVEVNTTLLSHNIIGRENRNGFGRCKHV